MLPDSVETLARLLEAEGHRTEGACIYGVCTVLTETAGYPATPCAREIVGAYYGIAAGLCDNEIADCGIAPETIGAASSCLRADDETIDEWAQRVTLDEDIAGIIPYLTASPAHCDRTASMEQEREREDSIRALVRARMASSRPIESIDPRPEAVLHVLSRFECFPYLMTLGQADAASAFAISLRSPNDTAPFLVSGDVPVLAVQCCDMLADEDWVLSEQDAALIIEFARRAIDEGRHVGLVHCDAGISRSAGVAAALLLWLHGTDWEVWCDPRRAPNPAVYLRVARALHDAGLIDRIPGNDEIANRVSVSRFSRHLRAIEEARDASWPMWGYASDAFDVDWYAADRG